MRDEEPLPSDPVHCASFPWRRLVDDLQVRGLAPSTAAERAGIRPCVVLPWVRGASQPRASGLRRFLEANTIDPQPYLPYLAEGGPLTLVCPSCGKERELPRGQLSIAGRRASGRTVLPRRDDGRYERQCKGCSSARVGRRALAIANKETRDAAREMKCRPIEVHIRRKQLEANWENFKRQAQRPKTEQHRRAISEGRRRRVNLERSLDLCALCGLLVHREPAAHKRGAVSWHKPCTLRWIYYRRSHPDAPRVPPRTRGRPGHRNLGRNLRWLLWTQKDTRTRTRIELLEGDGPNIAPYRSRRSRARRSARATVNAGVDSVILRLPGSWDLVFSPGYPKAVRARTTASLWSGRRARIRRDRARQYQKWFPLPDKLRPLVDAGDRDSLIERLHAVGMSENWIARLTGASENQVRVVIENGGAVEAKAVTRTRSASGGG